MALFKYEAALRPSSTSRDTVSVHDVPDAELNYVNASLGGS